MLGNWQAIGLALLLVLNVGQFAAGEVRLRARDRRIAALEERLSRTVDVATKADLRTAMAAMGEDVRRRVGGLEETIRAIPRGKDTIFVREVSRPGPAGPPGKPGAPGTPGTPPAGRPGTPLVPPAEQPRAREEASERIVAWFDEGTLVNCDAPGQAPSTVELLRQPGGRLLSTAPCVFRLDDEVRLRPAPPASRFSVGAYAGWSLRDSAVLGIRPSYRLTDSWSVEAPVECRRAGVLGSFPFVSCGDWDARILAVLRF